MAEEKPVASSNAPREIAQETSLLVRRGRVVSVDLYEIKDSELEILEKGSPADLQLNFAIFLLSSVFTAIVALCTATFTNENVKIAFIGVAVVGSMFGLYLMLSWWKGRGSSKAVCKAIRQRMQPEAKLIAPPLKNVSPPDQEAPPPRG